MTRCVIKKGAWRWYIAKANEESLAWSGSRWVPVTADGLPAGDIQVCNFSNEQEAVVYANTYGLRIATIRRN